MGRQHGIPFRWASLSDAQKAVLTAGDASSTNERVRYLRGERTREVANNGPFRTRTGVLGDIADSSPTWVGPPSAPYTAPWKDALHPSASAPEPNGSYASFKSSKATRENVVYVGANDGFLHGFRAGAYDSSGNFNSAAANDGRELIAYMPGSVSRRSIPPPATSTTAPHSIRTTSMWTPRRARATSTTRVRGTPGWSARSVPAAMRRAPSATELIATGAIFALDVTDPSRFSEADAPHSWLATGRRARSVAPTPRTATATWAAATGRPPSGACTTAVGRAVRQRAQQCKRLGRPVRHAGESQHRKQDLPLLRHRQRARGRHQERHRPRDAGRPRRRPHHRLRLCRRRVRQGVALRPDRHRFRKLVGRPEPAVHHACRPAHHQQACRGLGADRRLPKPRVIVGFGTGQRLVQTLTSAPTMPRARSRSTGSGTGT